MGFCGIERVLWRVFFFSRFSGEQRQAGSEQGAPDTQAARVCPSTLTNAGLVLAWKTRKTQCGKEVTVLHCIRRLLIWAKRGERGISREARQTRDAKLSADRASVMQATCPLIKTPEDAGYKIADS